MADLKQFLLPDIGEGLTEAEIIKWDVAPGGTVAINQTLVEIETAKAAVELPSPYAGVVMALHVAPGDTVDVGRPIITIDTAPPGPGGPATVRPAPDRAGTEPGREQRRPGRADARQAAGAVTGQEPRRRSER